MDKTELMASILKRHNLGNLIEVFQKEKITPDLVSLLSVSEMNQLGINNRADTMKLRMECAIHGKQKPQRERPGSGAPAFDIPKSIVENHLEEGFMVKEIASMLSVSESTIYRRMQSYGLSSLDFSDICDKDLDHHITELSKDFSLCREVMMKFLLEERGIKVQRMQLRSTVWIRKEYMKERKAACNQECIMSKALTICGILTLTINL